MAQTKSLMDQNQTLNQSLGKTLKKLRILQKEKSKLQLYLAPAVPQMDQFNSSEAISDSRVDLNDISMNTTANNNNNNSMLSRDSFFKSSDSLVAWSNQSIQSHTSAYDIEKRRHQDQANNTKNETRWHTRRNSDMPKMSYAYNSSVKRLV